MTRVILIALSWLLFGTSARAVEPSEMTAISVSVPLGELQFHLVPEWKDLSSVEQGFRMIRDAAILKVGSELRPIPWNNIGDGCWPRAALASGLLENAGLRRPAKLFVFGPLYVSTVNHAAGWWYHVVPIVAAEGRVFVLDPAVNPDRPQTLDEFMSRIIADPDDATLSICNPFAYLPWSMCYVSGPSEEEPAESDILPYL
ncbi:MAG: hypothetical protein A2X94_10285 [Bdellovibrionales bacterium GWB1_55_8]|nr:MAG: hypothetical protein A2X94_10285 [Bdellovibrionales bacterium GWB1_55_8]